MTSKPGKYIPVVDAPTGLPFDPPLTIAGREQALELATHLATLEPPVERFYSSPFYRCLQTIEPTISALNSVGVHGRNPKVRCESGLREWYTQSKARNPLPAEPGVLARLFPCLDTSYRPVVNPSNYGEDVIEFHFRIAKTMQALIEQSDRETTKTILLSTHASAVIAIGRALTGYMPTDVEEEDFKAYPCGLSKFVRRKSHVQDGQSKQVALETATQEHRARELGDHPPSLGDWSCTMNSDCSFLSDLGLNSWKFSRDDHLTSSMFHVSG